MDLKTFVSESIKGIVDGMIAAKGHAEENDALINPPHGCSGEATFYTENEELRHVQSLEFDLAIVVNDAHENKAGAAIQVLGLNIGGHKGGKNGVQLTSRLKFSIPVALPSMKRPSKRLVTEGISAV